MFERLQPWKLDIEDKVYRKFRLSGLKTIVGILVLILFIFLIYLDYILIVSLFLTPLSFYNAISYSTLLIVFLVMILYSYFYLGLSIEFVYLFYWYRRTQDQRLEFAGKLIDKLLQTPIKKWNVHRYERSIAFLLSNSKDKYSASEFFPIINGYVEILSKELPVVIAFNYDNILLKSVKQIRNLFYKKKSINEFYPFLEQVHKSYKEFKANDSIMKPDRGIKKYFAFIDAQKDTIWFLFKILFGMIALMVIIFYIYKYGPEEFLKLLLSFISPKIT